MQRMCYSKVKKILFATFSYSAFFILSYCFVHNSDARTANQIDYANYFLADIRDAEECSMVYEKGRFTFPQQVTNPAVTCPDMFSWKLYVEVVQQQFWSNWASERQNWPGEPYQLCLNGGTPGVDCCKPGASNNPEDHCPVFPRNRYKTALNRLNSANQKEVESAVDNDALLRIGIPSVMGATRHVSTGVSGLAQKLKLERSESLALPNCSQQVIDNLIPENYESIGRVIRQTNAELTVRNETFHNYLFDNNLYNATGVMDVFNNNANNLSRNGNQSNAPYHKPNYSASPNNKKANLARIDLPSDSVMIKSNWLHKELAQRLGMKNDPNNTYVTKYLATQLTANQETGAQCLWKGEHYLVAFHISSKDIPQWLWTTFEHVNLPGRCDITGCNDSYGYKSTDTLPPGVYDNYVAAHVKSDKLNSASTVFDRDKVYKAEERRPGLNAVFTSAGIGTGKSTSRYEPDPMDRAWLSYRLKGSQIEFTDLRGHSTFLGNSVTEAGFMDGSSCVTCHSRAGIHVTPEGKPNFFKLSVFELDLSDYGYAKSSHGIPNKNWFNDSDMPPSLDVLQTDFVWGFLFAREIVKP